MKIKVLLLIIISSLFTSCLYNDFEPSEWAVDPQLDFSKSVVLFNSAVSQDSVVVFTNYQELQISSSEDWCKVNIDYTSSMIKINADPNFNSEQRSAIITVLVSKGNKELSKNISVVQMGGVWEIVGDFNVYWAYSPSPSQKNVLENLLQNMIYVQGGGFLMGNTDDAIVDSATPHHVNLKSYYIGKFEITQEQFRAIMGYNPSEIRGEQLPVYGISWAEAMDFVTRFATLTNLKVSLPTEAQWEYAALGGKDSRGYRYSGSNDYSQVAVIATDENEMRPSDVGAKMSNELGIYDMSGNVAEYCSDWFQPNYVDANRDNPSGPVTGTFKCVRGGSFSDITTIAQLKCTNRFSWSKGINKITPFTGFRIVIEDEKK